MSATCAALWGYVVPSYLSDDWRWRVVALPVGVLCGATVWQRYRSRPVVDPLVAADVSVAERIAVTVAGVLTGVGGGVFIPLGLTRAFPSWTVALPLGMLLAILVGRVAWNNPALFFRNRRF